MITQSTVSKVLTEDLLKERVINPSTAIFPYIFHTEELLALCLSTDILLVHRQLNDGTVVTYRLRSSNAEIGDYIVKGHIRYTCKGHNIWHVTVNHQEV